MSSQRFFIGNVPTGVTEKDLRKAFQEHGDVTNIELKEKESLVDPGDVKLLAFITLNLYGPDVEFCLRKLNSKPINGEYVRVSVAKESFLERLKREREESTKGSPTTNGGSFSQSPVMQHEAPQGNNSKKYFNAEDDDDAMEDDDDVLITKKRAANSMRNGKIVIESTNCAPLHIIGKKKEVKQRLSEKSFDSDKKRKESVNKKKNQYQLQKSLIQKSLSAVDSSKRQKIKFDDADEDNESEQPSSKPLFEGDSGDEEDDSFANGFAEKPEYEGTKGAALMKLQSSMSLDPRFKVDRKFVDEVEEEPVRESKNTERDWQYGILEQVVGNKVTNNSHAKRHEKKQLKMLRYDPSKDNQDEFLVKQTEPEPMDDDEGEPADQPEKSQVSKEVFYVVGDSLTNSLKTRGDGFSLLSMFGQASVEKAEDKQAEEKILISKGDKNPNLNPFTYDSSDSENEKEELHAPKAGKAAQTNGEVLKDSTKPQAKVFVESFFIKRNDARLKEGKTFFRFNKSERAENYDEIKDKLKSLINTKINKSKRKLKGPAKKKHGRGR